jgi:hypothetical protein
MNRILPFLISLYLSTAAFAGVTYEFKVVTEGAGQGTMAGNAAISGDDMRLDISEGDNVVFRSDSVVLSNDRGETLIILDTKKKTYYEMNVEEIFSALGTVMNATGGLVKFNIKNQKVNVQEAGSGGTIEGYPTTKYVIDSSYDMEIRVLTMKNRSSIVSRTESYVTSKLGDVSPTFIQKKNFRTGIEELDELVAAQTGTMKGFALKNVTTTTTTDKAGKKTTGTSTMTISNIKKASVADSRFKIPAGYEETEEAPFIMGRE